MANLYPLLYAEPTDVSPILRSGTLIDNGDGTWSVVGTGLSNTAQVAATSPVTVAVSDSLVSKGFAGASIVNLPAGATLTSGAVAIKDKQGDASAFPIEVVAYSPETIDGQLSVLINVDYGSITFRWDGTEWART